MTNAGPTLSSAYIINRKAIERKVQDGVKLSTVSNAPWRPHPLPHARGLRGLSIGNAEYFCSHSIPAPSTASHVVDSQ